MIDVSAYIPQKVAAIAAHASQFPLKQDMLPISILEELMGREFFVRANMQPKIETELFPAAIHITAPAEGRNERRSAPLGRVLSEF